MNDKLKTVAIVAGFLGFLIGLILGAFTSYKILNARLYNEMRDHNHAIWVRIDALEGSKDDLLYRMDRLARLLNEYDLAVAQIAVYEKRKEIMNIRFSDGD